MHVHKFLIPVGVGIVSLALTGTAASAWSGTQDGNGDGIPDGVLIDSRDDGVTDVLAEDRDQNGVLEVVSFDTNNDGVFDAVGYDTNQNGTLDQARFDYDFNGDYESISFDLNENGLEDATEATDLAASEMGATVIGPPTDPGGFYTLMTTMAAFTGQATFGTPDSDYDGFNDLDDYYPTDPTRA